MKPSRALRIAPLCLLAFATTLAGCKRQDATSRQEKTEARAGGNLDFVPSEEELNTIDALVKRINQRTQRFPYSEAIKKSNARLFTYLAATSDDPVVISASLQAIQSAYAHRSAQKEAPNADLERAVLKHLKSQQPEILGRALMASRVTLMGPNPSAEITQALVGLAKEHRVGPARYGILEALSRLRPASQPPAVTDVFVSSVQNNEEPYVLSIALEGLHRKAPESKIAPELRTRALELVSHADPGVRGRALRLASTLGSSEHPETILKMRSSLADEHPYVRAEACEALARSGHQPAAHDVMKLVQDGDRISYDLKGWQLLDGRPGNVRHRVSGKSTVADVALNTVAQLSDGQLKLEPVDKKQPEAARAKNLELAQAWYLKAKGQIPRDPAPPAPVVQKAAQAGATQASTTAAPPPKPLADPGLAPKTPPPSSEAKPAAPAAAQPAPKPPAASSEVKPAAPSAAQPAPKPPAAQPAPKPPAAQPAPKPPVTSSEAKPVAPAAAQPAAPTAP